MAAPQQYGIVCNMRPGPTIKSRTEDCFLTRVNKYNRDMGVATGITSRIEFYDYIGLEATRTYRRSYGRQ